VHLVVCQQHSPFAVSLHITKSNELFNWHYLLIIDKYDNATKQRRTMISDDAAA